MHSDDQDLQVNSQAEVISKPQTVSNFPDNGKPVWIDPDLDFIESLSKRTGELFKKCMQCGTCSGTCAIAPDHRPFPGKEMAWASWGMKDRLLGDPDVWLCFQCNDCSTRCPRGARPGDLLGAIRQESVTYHAFPHFLGRWVNHPQYLPFLLSIPLILLSLVLYLKGPIENALGISRLSGERIVYSYSAMFPHWLLNGFFLIISIFILLAVIMGIRRFWRTLKEADEQRSYATPAKSLTSSILITFKKIILHENFAKCTAAHFRYLSHMFVFFGFAALSVVTFWIITSGINPLLQKDFVYPFGFWSPWKMLANIGGLALLGGLSLIILDRFKKSGNISTGSYFDWTLISTLLIVVISGFITEVLHYIRLEPHRHIAYFFHLVFACALLMYLPYSKLAHMIYRTLAMIYAEYTGKNVGGTKPVEVKKS